MSGKGRLKCQCFSRSSAEPISKTKITLTSSDPSQRTQIMFTDSSGITETIEVITPDMEASQRPGTVPYSTYDIKVEKPGFAPLSVKGVQVYPNRLAIQNCNLSLNITNRAERAETIEIQENILVGDFPPKIPEKPIKPLPVPSDTVVLPEVVVPQFVVVHNGVPNDVNVANYTVSYSDYIKNVASSEIFSTWPVQAIEANIYCIISFTLNRVYSEWYKGKGKNFTITNSTAYDQAFNYGRTIYDNISNIVDRIFATYIKPNNEKQPLLAQYCNGTTVTCPNWLSQWGSKFLADQGDSSLQILQNYYGYNFKLTTAPKVQGIPTSFPGYTLGQGANNIYVRRLQGYLNSISNNYPAIPKVNVDGNFGPTTANAVKIYQGIFNLPQTGIVDYATWYSISNIYVAVNKIAQGIPREDEYVRDSESGIFIPPVMSDLKENIPRIKY